MQHATGAIVVGVDGSDASEQALDWAAEQAALEGRPLTVVHAGDTWSVPAEGREVLHLACKRAEQRDGVPAVRSELVMGDPRTVLLEAATKAHTLVVGSRGLGPVRSLLLGSVALTLTQHAGCPVVVCRPHPEQSAGRGVMVGVEATGYSVAAVEWAFRQAELRRLPLTLARTVFDGYPPGVVGPDEAGAEQAWTGLRDVAAAFARRHPGVDVHLELRRGLADEALVQSAAGMDLVVLGTHTRRSVLGLLDLNVTTGVVVHAPCVVAIVPHQD